MFTSLNIQSLFQKRGARKRHERGEHCTTFIIVRRSGITCVTSHILLHRHFRRGETLKSHNILMKREISREEGGHNSGSQSLPTSSCSPSSAVQSKHHPSRLEKKKKGVQQHMNVVKVIALVRSRHVHFAQRARE